MIKKNLNIIVVVLIIAIGAIFIALMARNIFLYYFVSVEGTIEDAVQAYANTQFPKAKSIASKHLEEPLGKLIFCSCQIFDIKNLNYNSGLAGLKELYEDTNIPTDIRVEAAISYARVIQVFQTRGIYAEYKEVAVEKVYKDILNLDNNDRRACTTAVYLMELYINSKEKQGDEKIIKFTDNFVNNFNGEKKYLVPVHMAISNYYLVFKNNYVSAVEHLKKAYELGIERDLLKRDVLFRIARISEYNLDDLETGKKYYEEFLRLYPDALTTPVVKRYLKDLQEKEKDING
ncbi:MAG: hypothetical protein WC496_01685 [Phycisphaerae bacterium]|jgi:tetratricopeptide (TPR) repeat protein